MTVFAPGKLLLFGEHAAVFGYPAVGMALSRGLTVTLRPSKSSNAMTQRLSIEIGDTEEIPAPLIPRFITHIEAVARSFDIPPLAGAMTVASELPIGSGFGSSAALCTAIARLLIPDSRDDYAIWRVAHRLERYFHGTPSGIDTGLTALGGVRAFRFTTPHTPAADSPLPATGVVHLPECTLAVGSIPRERSTRELVAQVRERQRTDPATVDAMFSRLGTLGEAVLHGGCSAPSGEVGSPLNVPYRDRAVSEERARSFGRAASDAQLILRELGVSTPTIDKILDIGMKAGALGGKLSGAGGGGAFFFVGAGEEEASRVCRRIQHTVAGAGGFVFPPVTPRLSTPRYNPISNRR